MNSNQVNANRHGKGGLDRIIEGLIGLARPSVTDMSHIRSLEAGWERCVRCGQPVGAGEATTSGCGSCRGAPGILDGVITLGPFEGLLAEGIRALKYQARGELADVLGMHLALAAEKQFQKGFDSEHWIAVAMPMPFWRKIDRRVDHASLIAHSLARRLGIKVIQPLKKGPGLPQAGLSRTNRERASHGDIWIRRRGFGGFARRLPCFKGKSVLLVDDVLTTGRSMMVAGGALRQLEPVSVHAAVLAVSTNRNLEHI
tara:strand:- start:824 stop:1594 length:771 start_codon:yes stop_codon:yes gene_type:complete